VTATDGGGRTVDRLVAEGAIGGRTVQIASTGDVEVATYPAGPTPAGSVRVRTVLTAISPGTEMTFYGRDATNVYLHRRWNADLRIFEPGEPALDYPVTFGYRAAGEVVESDDPRVPAGTRLFGNWRHTEWTAVPVDNAAAQRLPDGLPWEDAVDLGQMGPICVNAALASGGEEADRPAVVFGAGPIGLITAQVVRASGASSVTVVDRLAERVAMARNLGLDGLVADGSVDVAAELKRRHGADGIPVAWECSGAIPALHAAIRCVARRGSVVAVGFYQGNAGGLTLGDEFHHNAVRIVSAQIGNPIPPFDRPALQQRTLELLRSGALVLGSLPRVTLPVENVADGFAMLGRPAEVLQVALSW
jgi:NADPH:quinone reductase-like Zn-dependent oxidoreductase